MNKNKNPLKKCAPIKYIRKLWKVFKFHPFQKLNFVTSKCFRSKRWENYYKLDFTVVLLVNRVFIPNSLLLEGYRRRQSQVKYIVLKMAVPSAAWVRIPPPPLHCCGVRSPPQSLPKMDFLNWETSSQMPASFSAY